MSVTLYDLVGEYDAVMWRIPDGDYVLYEDYARLRAAVAALMERGSDVYPWWCRMDDGWVSCQWCYHCAFGSAEGLAHAPDCPAMAVEAEMRDETDDAN